MPAEDHLRRPGLQHHRVRSSLLNSVVLLLDATPFDSMWLRMKLEPAPPRLRWRIQLERDPRETRTCCPDVPLAQRCCHTRTEVSDTKSCQLLSRVPD